MRAIWWRWSWRTRLRLEKVLWCWDLKQKVMTHGEDTVPGTCVAPPLCFRLRILQYFVDLDQHEMQRSLPFT